MINRHDFEKAETYEIDKVSELLPLAKELREKNPTFPFIILIHNKENEKLHFSFPYDYFDIVFEDGYLEDDLYAKQLDEEGKELTTWKTATLKATGSHNIFENLHVRNTSLDPIHKGQEVALAVYGDDNLFLGGEFDSTQDTLFSGPLPDDLSTRYLDFIPEEERYHEGNCTNYYVGTIIKGTVDFIFGAGRAIFYQNRLVSLNDGRKESYVAAPSHSLKDDFGYLFFNCSFEKEGAEVGSVYLARPWRDYGKAVFANCTYQDHISPLGFHDWSDVDRTRTARFEEYPLREGRVSWVKNQPRSLLPERYRKAIQELRENLEKQ
ncbi:MAG: pectinesterase family protein [Eubacteriales bacterium]|nr:pectinesterase family protein [Eubacteriales bacterium]